MKEFLPTPFKFSVPSTCIVFDVDSLKSNVEFRAAVVLKVKVPVTECASLLAPLKESISPAATVNVPETSSSPPISISLTPSKRNCIPSSWNQDEVFTETTSS